MRVYESTEKKRRDLSPAELCDEMEMDLHLYIANIADANRKAHFNTLVTDNKILAVCLRLTMEVESLKRQVAILKREQATTVLT